MTLGIAFSSAPLGHQLIGVDIAKGVSTEQFEEIEAAFNKYGVVSIRGQTITPELQVEISRRFGPTERYGIDTFLLPGHPEIFVVSNIVEQGKPIGMADAGRVWHSDMCFIQHPPRCSLLYALEVPRNASGEPLGDTCFSSTQAAYDALPGETKRKIDGLTVRNSYSAVVERKQRQQLDEGGVATQQGRLKAQAQYPDVVHPLVRSHPFTGRKCLYLSEGMSVEIIGWEASEGEKLISELLQHMTKPEFIYRHRWCEGDLVIWDNCSAIHLALPDFSASQRRRMHRTTILYPNNSSEGVAA